MPVYQNSVPKTCRQGDKGPAVSYLQAVLARSGWPVAADGAFGSLTFAALRAYQQSHKLTADGICGPVTWESLLVGGSRLVRYRQTDPRWKATAYTSVNDPTQTIGSSGCGPTSMAIALSSYGITAQPPELCKFSTGRGFRTPSSGTSWGFFAAAAAKYGLAAMQCSVDGAVKALAAGRPVIASMGPDGYTKGGHYICLRDYDRFSEIFYTIDPASALRNSCDKALMSRQSKAFWAVG